jgi:hypothetical protein
LYLVLLFLDFEMIFYTSKSTFIFSMQQCAVRQFENELVERLSILANRHLRPPAPKRGPHSMGMEVMSEMVVSEVLVGYVERRGGPALRGAHGDKWDS